MNKVKLLPLVPLLLVVAACVALALTAHRWAPLLLSFVGANTEMIQGLTDLVQLVLWVGAGAVVVIGWWRNRRTPQTIAHQRSDDQAQPAVSTGERGAGAGRDIRDSIVIPGDQNVVVVTQEVAADFWRRVGTRRLDAAALEQTTQAYLNFLVSRYRYLDFKGMGMADRVALQLPLLEMYVPLQAHIELPEGETWARQLRLAGRAVSDEEAAAMGQRLSKPTPLIELLARQDGLIVLGDPGSGKTTFLKFVTLCVALGQGQALGLAGRLPILAPLSAYANALAERDVSLQAFLGDYFHDRGIHLPVEEMFEEALAQGGALLLLDGLDEVKELGQRHLVVSRVVEFFAYHRLRGNKFILTSRVVGYREVRPTAEGLAECTLVDFGDEEIEAFVDRWTAALEKAAQGATAAALADAAQEKAELIAATRNNPGVRQLAANPLLLTILALMKRQGVTLPERRVELYQKYIETLLRHWNLARGLDRPPSRDLDVVETLRVLAPLALWMHESSPGIGLVKREEMRRQLEQIYAAREEPNPEVAAQQLLADAREYAGLLLERGAGEYGFIHLTFQEYLAAVAIAQQGQRDVSTVAELLAAHVDDTSWHEVTLLAVGYMGIIQQRDEAAGEVVQRLVQSGAGEPGAATVRAGEAVVDAWPGGVTRACQTAVVQALLATMTDPAQVRAPLRAAAGRALGKLGDPRPEVMTVEAMQFCYVPAGPFRMGEGEEEHTVEIPYDFWMSRYPVTNAQYKAFVVAGGYAEPAYWAEAIEAGFWSEGRVQDVIYALDDKRELIRRQQGWRSAPINLGDPHHLPNHPVVGVSWYEALAFCRWLTVHLRQQGVLGAEQSVRLPSEAEWEKVARGGLHVLPDALIVEATSLRPTPLLSLVENPRPARIYPWGDEDDAERANYDDTGIGATSAAGCFAHGAGPCGVEEMAGNVWEWTQSLWGEDWRYPYNAGDGREETRAPASVRRVLRGGSWDDLRLDVRCVVRFGNDPGDRLNLVGFRVVAPGR
ncbi:MAG: hypothetical protein DCC55_29030 [Chloroflexi bacterium]|nr:MAG: hypothetical protein DCC55_29030 [Chloroflexota bacterium]